MAWTIEYGNRAIKELKQIDREAAKRIKKYLDAKIAPCDNPRTHGEPLLGNLSGYWRYRIGDYRVIADIQDEKIIVLIVHIGHSSKIYGGH